VTLLKGGVGGKGNAFFKSSTNQAPRKTTPGLPGESGVYRLELRSIADVGLVGFPNAGKSTLLGLLSNARPRTADYPFTTLTPMLGVLPPAGPDGRPVRIADIPGLIEGASENRGLGHRFLRHIERCGLLLVLIDAAATDARDPVEDYRQLVHELSLYGAGLEAKPRLVVANKMDEPGANEQLPRLEKACAPARVLALSCLSEEGLPGLKQALRERVGAAPAAPGPASG
jgi:GTP-binding protein